jgi:hypothetical protein
MYLWKCWRDTRWFFVVFLAIAGLPMPMAAFASRFAAVIREAGPMAFKNTFAMVATAVAYSLATICAIQEFTDKTAHFLFTKPRSRAYFVWMSWLVGFAELLIVAAVNLFVGWRVLAHYGVRAFSDAGPQIQNWNLVSPEKFIASAVYACFAYTLTFALAAILRSGLKGLGGSLGLLSGMIGVSVLLQTRWKIHLPLPPQQIAHLPLALSECAWIALALLFVLAAQLVTERAEI